MRRVQKSNEEVGQRPVFFMDSINVRREDLQQFNPNQIAAVPVFKGDKAIALLGEAGRDGAVYIETKGFARQRYWSFFKSHSQQYAAVAPTPESDATVQCILNGIYPQLTIRYLNVSKCYAKKN